MTLRLVRTTLVTLLLVGTTACGLPGGGGPGSPCDNPDDDEPTSVVVSSADPSSPDEIHGCIDSSSDVDTITLNRPGGATGTSTFNVRCFAATGVAEFDTPVILDPGTPCVPIDPPFYNHGNQTSSTVTVRALAGSDGGEYRIEILVGQD